MSDLILDSLEIKNFRLFKHLEIERLGRVNLIVGKNGVGKTALLEALRLYAHRGTVSVIGEVLIARQEIGYRRPRGSYDDISYQAEALSYLFHGYKHISDISEPIVIGALGSNKEGLTIALKKGKENDADEMGEDLNRMVSVRFGKQEYRLGQKINIELSPWAREETGAIHSFYSSLDGLSKRQIERLWEKALLNKLEKEVLEAVRIIKPDMEDLYFIGEVERHDNNRIPVVSTKNIDRRIPLRNLGDGMSRLLGIALALINARDDILLIDEIESGLHYSVQPAVWRLIFETAAKLNVQVFATTHSLDCLRAFESAAKERGEDESLLISLRRHRQEPEKIVAVLAGKEDLEIIIHSHIEAR